MIEIKIPTTANLTCPNCSQLCRYCKECEAWRCKRCEHIFGADRKIDKKKKGDCGCSDKDKK